MSGSDGVGSAQIVLPRHKHKSGIQSVLFFTRTSKFAIETKLLRLSGGDEMLGKRFSIGLKMALTMFTLTLLVASSWATPHESVLHSFNNDGADGVNPYAGLIFDAAGNLYGTTVEGGIHG